MITYNNTPNKWGTFNGDIRNTKKLTKQHLSNIYWYHLVFFDIEHKWVKAEIRKQFDGKLSPYVPCKEFIIEHQMLRQRNMLKFSFEIKNDLKKFDIWWKGNKIGYLWN